MALDERKVQFVKRDNNKRDVRDADVGFMAHVYRHCSDYRWSDLTLSWIAGRRMLSDVVG